MHRVLVIVLAALLAGGCASEAGGAEEGAAAATGTELVLAGDGELWVVDVERERARRFSLRQLAPGSPPHRILRRGERFVLWGYDTYSAADFHRPLRRIARDSWFFIPSSHPERIWVAVLDPSSPATQNRLRRVREITTTGVVTVRAAEPPGGRWPQGAVAAGLLIFRGGAMTVWDPRTRRTVSRIRLRGDIGPTHGNTIASCAGLRCRTLRLTQALSGNSRVIRAPAGSAFLAGAASFSPGGDALAVPVVRAGSDLPYEQAARLGIVELASGRVSLVPGSKAPPYYFFTAWSATGEEAFLTGGRRFEERVIVAYRLGQPRARRLGVDVGDFYGMAAR